MVITHNSYLFCKTYHGMKIHKKLLSLCFQLCLITCVEVLHSTQFSRASANKFESKSYKDKLKTPLLSEVHYYLQFESLERLQCKFLESNKMRSGPCHNIHQLLDWEKIYIDALQKNFFVKSWIEKFWW